MTIVADRRSAASCETISNRSRDRKRSCTDTTAALPRAAVSDCDRKSISTRRHQQTSGRNEQTCHDHIVWSERQTIHQRATAGSARRRVTGVSQQESKTPSRGSLPFGGIRCADRYTLDCLPSAIRSQGFSPSQRFHPGTPSWLLFQATSAHRLHGPSELLPSRPAVVPLGTHLLSCHRALQDAPASRHVCGANELPVRQAERTVLDTPPEALATELCSDRASDTLRDE